MKAIFIGSSVCQGCGSYDHHHGWQFIVSEQLKKDGWEVEDTAIPGQNSADILLRLERDVIVKSPTVCFVGLGLANEGLPNARTKEEGEQIAYHYLRNLKAIADALMRKNITPIIGGLYPHNRYLPFHYGILKKSEEIIKDWGCAYLPFLPTVDDGNGHWQEGLFQDDGHPNDLGYQKMAEAFTPALLDKEN